MLIDILQSKPKRLAPSQVSGLRDLFFKFVSKYNINFNFVVYRSKKMRVDNLFANIL